MAARRSYASDRRQSGGYRSMQYGSRQAYMYGNIVTKPEYEPRRRKSSAKPKKKVSRQVQKNRNRALHMNAAYVIFLAVAATVVLLLCVNYVRLQSELTRRSKHVTALQEELADLKEQKLTLLKSAGFPADYMELRYDCPDCQDTGYVNGKRCHCFERQRLNILYAQSNIEAVLKEENFDHLRFDFYDDTEKVPQLGMTERAYMDVVVRQCREFAQQYPAKGNSILFTGGTGVGKTFLTNCIAKELIDRCISVIYLSSNELFEIFSKYKFGRESEEDAEESYRYILECDMLIIDDLGTELNKRIGRKKGTIISTNLSMSMLMDTYSDRVTSRIMSNYRVIPLYGADIRMKKRVFA